MVSNGFVDPYETVLIDQKRAGEMLVSQLRILGLLLVVPPSLIRIFGYGIFDYLPFGVVQWGVFMLYSLGVYLLLKRGVYHPFMGYATLFLDLCGLAFSMVLFSLFSPQYTGLRYETLFAVYYIIALSSALRFDYRYAVFCVLVSVALVGLQSVFDHGWHHIPVNLYCLGEWLFTLIAITGLSILMTQRFRRVVLSGYDFMTRRMQEIASILRIGRNVSEQGDLDRKLDKILREARGLLQSDMVMLGVMNATGDAVERILIKGEGAGALREAWLEPQAGLLGGLLRQGGVLRIDEPRELEGLMGPAEDLAVVLGVPLETGGQIAGALLVGRREVRPYTGYDEMLLGTLAGHAAASVVQVRLFEALNNELELHESAPAEKRVQFEAIIGRSERMQKVYRLIEKAAVSDIPVLVRGESGTGKELVAQALHRLSSRGQGPFIKINCAAIPETLLESELFGHERGAFTGAHRTKKGKFELAHRGSVFLDEIGDMSLSLQIKLLRVIQEKRFERVGGEVTLETDVRIISATNQNLERKIEENRFRQDLFYRINGLPIHTPPLRERREDIPLLLATFIERYANGREMRFSKSAMNYLMSRSWRGNVRELENLVQRLVVVTEHETISARDISAIDAPDSPDGDPGFSAAFADYIDAALHSGSTLSHEVIRVEKGFIQKALLISGGNIREASRILNIPKSTLFNKISKYDIRA